MITRQLNMFLWTSAAVLSCGAVAVLAFGLFSPLQPGAAAATSTTGSKNTSQRAATELPPVGATRKKTIITEGKTSKTVHTRYAMYLPRRTALL